MQGIYAVGKGKLDKLDELNELEELWICQSEGGTTEESWEV